MILEPSEELQALYDKAVNIAIEHQHEYLTLEHLVFAIMTDKKFLDFIEDFQGDANYVRINLEHFIKYNLKDIVVTETKKSKPQKTQSVDRCLNRAFTQVLFHGRQRIEVNDLFLSVLSERKSYSVYYLSLIHI